MEGNGGAGRNIDCVLAELRERHDAVKEGDVVAQAEAFAARCHAGQTRKDGVTPYIVHPAEVVATLRSCGISDGSVLAAAWLHDVVEDTPTTLEEVTAEFGERIGLLVDVLTRRGKGKRDRERYHSRILKGESAAQLVKVADLEHNFRSMEYLDEEAQERKLREAREYYLPLRDGLCEEYSCDALFSTLERRVRDFERREDGDDGQSRTYVVVRQEWMESERGWGQKPYGYSLHLTEPDRKAFIEDHWKDWPDEVPDWYYGPDWSSPKPFEVDEKTYREIKASRNGVRRW